MMRRSLLAGLLAFPCHMVMAGTSVSDALDAGKSFGSDALGQTQSYSTHQDASGVPNYQGADGILLQALSQGWRIRDALRCSRYVS